jgi:hypothetical protein
MSENLGFIIFVDSILLGTYSSYMCVSTVVSYAVRYNQTVIDWIFG